MIAMTGGYEVGADMRDDYRVYSYSGDVIKVGVADGRVCVCAVCVCMCVLGGGDLRCALGTRMWRGERRGGR